MSYTVINGCEVDNTLQKDITAKIKAFILKEKKQKNVNWIELSDYNLKDCVACDYCQATNPGLCTINDGQNDILRQYMASDTVVIITPIKFGCCNSLTKDFIDRTQSLALPYQVTKNGNTMMAARYKKYPSLFFIGINETSKEEYIESFKTFISGCNFAQLSQRCIVTTIDTHTDIDFLNHILF